MRPTEYHSDGASDWPSGSGFFKCLGENHIHVQRRLLTYHKTHSEACLVRPIFRLTDVLISAYEQK